MKEEEKTKPSKKKILTRVLVAAACLLVIAAITLSIVFTVGRKPNTLDVPPAQGEQSGNEGSGGQSGGNQGNEGNQGGQGGNEGSGSQGGNQGSEGETPGGSQGTSTQSTFITPVKEVSVAKAYEFGYDKTMDWYCLHEGMDFTAAAGTEVLASLDGTVVEITTEDSDILYGGSVTLEHADGLKTVYMFIDVDPDLKVGAKVSRGDVLGTVAAANGMENADGEHLHFEVFKNGESVDPDEYLNVLSK